MITDTRNAVRSITSGPRTVIMQGPTGVGKTVTMAAMAKTSMGMGNRVIFTVHRRELLHQSCRALDSWNIRHGIIASGYPMDDAMMHVASINTLVRRMQKIQPPDLIIVDEAHHAMAGQWAQVIRHWPGATVVGLTATPQRLDGKGLGELFQRLVIGPTTSWLIENKYLSPFRLFAPPNGIDTSSVKSAMGDFKKDQLAVVCDKNSITGNAVEHYVRHASGKRAIVFCVSIKHAEHVAEEFQKNGIEAIHITGMDDRDHRDDVMRKFAAGEIKVLCSVDLISEGFDVPAVEAIIMLRPTQSLTLYLQQIGRALRYIPGKTAIILDHAGNCNRHGMPDAARTWSLAGKQKKSTKDADDISIVTCSQCYAVFRPAPECPVCGFEQAVNPRKIQEVDGDLVEIDPKELARIRARQISGAHTFDELEVIRKARGYKPGWTEHIMKSRRQRYAERA
ncbi:MAG: DEAD/DEAH box helicase [Magnetococcales bacterium]|nr:DEAD/DEAH box helicase [Magnetococcales bacterium]